MMGKMIVNNGKYYLYRHIRLDTNEPFYVGIGTKYRFKAKAVKEVYSRAYQKGKRRSFWKNIVKKSNYDVDIILESDDYNFIKQKEIEFIKLYGRKDLNEGTLVNLTDGGEGCFGYTHPDNVKTKMVANSGMKGVKGKHHPAATPIYQYSLEGIFMGRCDSIIDVARDLNVGHNKIQQCLYTEKPHRDLPYMWYRTFRGYHTSIARHKVKNTVVPKTKVYQFSLTGEFIKEWESFRAAGRLIGGGSSYISRAVRSESHYAMGYKWSLYRNTFTDDILTIVFNKILTTYKRSVEDTTNNQKDESK